MFDLVRAARVSWMTCDMDGNGKKPTPNHISPNTGTRVCIITCDQRTYRANKSQKNSINNKYPKFTHTRAVRLTMYVLSRWPSRTCSVRKDSCLSGKTVNIFFFSNPSFSSNEISHGPPRTVSIVFYQFNFF